MHFFAQICDDKFCLNFVMERLSQKKQYARNKERYYDEVIDLYFHGKTAREIAQIVPDGWMPLLNSQKKNYLMES